jgi:hypothetical protein
MGFAKDSTHPTRPLTHYPGMTETGWSAEPVGALRRPVGLARPARSAYIVEPLQSDCLTGKSLARFRDPRVQPLCEKYFPSPLTQIRCISKPVPCPQEGRFAVVTDVGHGMRWTRGRQARMAIAGRDEPRERSAGAQDDRRFLRTAKSCRSGTRCWC